MHHATRRFLLALVPVLDGACLIGTSQLGDPTDGTSGSTGDTPTSAETTTSASTTPGETTETPPTTSTTDDPSLGSSSGGDEPSTTGPDDDTTSGAPTLGEPCDVWTQDCAAGLKCNPWIDGGIAWNAARCVDIVDNPQALGASCIGDDGGTTGNDDCDLGAMCFFVGVDTDVGVCTELCRGSEEDPQCAPQTGCGVFNEGALPLCLATCDPLAPDCPENQGCYAEGDAFLCMPIPFDPGDYLDDCTMIAQCNTNHLCIDGEAVTGCEADACCTPICNLEEMPDNCPEGSTGCVPYYEEGQAPEGFEWVGFCG